MKRMSDSPPGNRPDWLICVHSIIYAVVFYLTTALFLILGSWLFFAPRSWAMKGLEIHGRTCVKLLKLICGTGFELRGAENIPDGGCLVVSKHQSAWDTFGLIPVFRDPAVVLKDELKWIPFYGWFCVKFEHILVRRERASVALKKMTADAQNRFSQSRQILIFPEGTRRNPGAPPDYKPGYVALYEGLGTAAVPLALNSGLFWPRRSFLRYPGTIVVSVLPPIPSGLPRKEFSKRMQAAIEDESNKLIAEALAKPNPPPGPACE